MGESRPGSDVDVALDSSAFVHLRHTVEQLMAEDVYPAGDSTAVALELLTAAHGVASMLIAKPHLPWGDVEDFADRVLTAVCLGQITRGAIDRDAPGGPDRHPTERTTRCRARSITRSSRGCGP
jgi:hypothetical protein